MYQDMKISMLDPTKLNIRPLILYSMEIPCSNSNPLYSMEYFITTPALVSSKTKTGPTV